MQKKKNTRFRAVDKAIILLCLAGSISSGIAFWMEYNRTLTKINETPVGTITFKRRTAQRKFIDRAVWDRLRQTSPLYNGDTIRTIEFSEAVVVFRDDVTSLSMDENTLIQIFYDDEYGARINFSGGNVNVFSGSKAATIIADSSEVVVRGEANLKKRTRDLSVAVMGGNASFDGERLETGNIIAIDERGQRDTRPAITMTKGSPAVNRQDVRFSWITSNFNNNTTVIIEIARDKKFTQIVGSAETAGNITAAAISVGNNGSYWWRVYPAGENKQPANSVYPIGSIKIVPPPPAIAAEPEPAPAPQPAPPPRPTPAPVPAPRPTPAPTSPPAITMPPPAVPAPPAPVPPPTPPSIAPAPEPVRVQPPAPPPAPVARTPREPIPVDKLRQVSGRGTITETFPHDGYSIYTEQVRNAQSLYFSWAGNADGYEFALYRANGDVVVPRTSANNSAFILDNPAVLTEGEYIWHIFENGKEEEGEEEAEGKKEPELPSTANSFRVIAGTAAIRILPTIEPGELYGQE